MQEKGEDMESKRGNQLLTGTHGVMLNKILLLPTKQTAQDKRQIEDELITIDHQQVFSQNTNLFRFCKSES